MSELLWPMYHDLRKRLEAVEAWIKQAQQPAEPTVSADYNEPSAADVAADQVDANDPDFPTSA